MDTRDGLLDDVARRAKKYLNTIGERPVAPRPEDLARLRDLTGPTPDGPTDPADVLRMLDEIGSPATLGTAGPRFYGWVIGASLPATTAAAWLAAAWDQNSASWGTSPVASTLEDSALEWMADILGLPAGCTGTLVTGATMASFTSLATARHALLTKAGWNVEADGLFGAPEVKVVIGAEAHPTVFKALGLLGFGRTRVIEVPVDDQGRMRADALPDVHGPVLVSTQAGNVNTGACDPLDAICNWARERDAWVHVDGAFGLWAAAAPVRKHVTKGYERADSWATDGHKWLNVPYDCGIAFVRDGEALRATMAVTAAYFPPPGEHRDPSAYTPELSQRARGIEVWAALKSLGRDGVAELVERCCRHATRFAEGLTEAGYAVLNDVVLNQVLVSFGDPEITERTIAAIQEDGTCWCGGTVWQGRTAMRISVSSWATTDEDVERSLEAMVRCARAVAARTTAG
jgi:glutamate/tyrosine decarboxylase-like PLP-dependent enzyme